MTWAEQAAPALAATMAGNGNIAFAAAAVDSDGTAIRSSRPEDTTERRYEIGSVTKTMTATVLALLAGEEVLSLEDPIGRWLQAGDNGAITVGQLATHTSGLPRLPPNLDLPGADPDNPWAGYGFDQAEAGLRASRLATDDQPWQYSNLGYQLLALILQRATDRPFEQLLTERILEPLGMTSSIVSGTSLSTGTAHPLGAGGVEATIQDLARYARACLFPEPTTPLGAAIARAQTPVVTVGDNHRQGLAWLIRDDGVREHSGGTMGYTACVSIRPDNNRAVALLAAIGGSPARASHLKRAAQLALAGQDPRRSVQPEPYPAWRKQATDMVRAMLAGDFAGAHERLAPARRDNTTPERLRQAWEERTRSAAVSQKPGAATPQDPDIAIVRDEVGASGGVLAEVLITFADEPRRLRLLVQPDGAIGGLTFLP